MKGIFFGGTSADERSEGDRLYPCGLSQGAEPATAVTCSILPFYYVVITAEASVLFGLSQEMPPPQQRLRVFSPLTVCIRLLKEEMLVYGHSTI